MTAARSVSCEFFFSSLSLHCVPNENVTYRLFHFHFISSQEETVGSMNKEHTYSNYTISTVLQAHEIKKTVQNKLKFVVLHLFSALYLYVHTHNSTHRVFPFKMNVIHEDVKKKCFAILNSSDIN